MKKAEKKTSEEMRATITAVSFAAALFLILALCLFAPDRDFSENENRSLAQRPELSGKTLLNGNFTADFEKYVSDQMIGRDRFIEIKSRSDRAAGKNDNGSVYFGKENYLFQIEAIDEVQMEKNLSYLRLFFEKGREVNPSLRVSILAAPTSTEILKDKLPPYAPVPDETAAVAQIREAFPRETCDVIPTLIAHKKEAVYYHTDHHWTTLGAYYAYAKWAEEQGFAAPELTDYQVTDAADDFYGTLYSKAGIRTEADTIQRFDKKGEGSEPDMRLITGQQKRRLKGMYDAAWLKKKDKYAYFLSGNNSLTIIENPRTSTGRTLLLIKDSYAHCFVPFLTEQFDRIVAVDLRYYKDSAQALYSEFKVTDLLVLYNIIGFSSDRNLAYLMK